MLNNKWLPFWYWHIKGSACWHGNRDVVLLELRMMVIQWSEGWRFQFVSFMLFQTVIFLQLRKIWYIFFQVLYNLLIFLIFLNSFLFAKFAFKRKKKQQHVIHLYKVSKKRISDLIYSCETFFQQIDIHNYAFLYEKILLKLLNIVSQLLCTAIIMIRVQ